jgi:hypothetical protein
VKRVHENPPQHDLEKQAETAKKSLAWLVIDLIDQFHNNNNDISVVSDKQIKLG